MSEINIEKVLKDVVYGGVGAVATALEVGGCLAKSLVEKGQETVKQGQERASEFRQAMKDACQNAQEDPGIDVSALTRAQRDQLRRQLDEMDAYEDAQSAKADEACEADGGCGCTGQQACDCPAPEAPMNENVTYASTEDSQPEA